MDVYICHYCNALAELHLTCPACGGTMEDYGALQNILGPYAPYEENDLQKEFTCVHQVYCPNCQEIYQINIPRAKN